MPSKFVSRLIKNIIGMNNYDDSTSLTPGVVKLIQNMIPKKTSLDTREGWVKYNSTALPGSSGVYGIGYYAPSVNLNLDLAVSNGKLYSGEGGVFTERYSPLSSTTLCTIVQFDDVALICDQVNKVIVYRHGESPFQIGIPSPKDYKLIDDFENAADWTMTNGTASNNKVNKIYGTQCIRFLSTTGGAMVARKTISSINLTVHGDGSASSTSDYISFYLIRGVYASFTNCFLDLGEPTWTNFYSIRLDTLPEWTATSAPNVAFEFKIRKSAFTATGSPNWNNITGVRFRVQAASGQQAQITVDFMRLEKTGPVTTTPCTADPATDTFTSTAHGLSNGDTIFINATTMPTGLSSTTLYYIVSAATNTFKVSLTLGGSAVGFTTAGVNVRWIRGAAGNLTGTYHYRVTYMTVDGWESDPSVMSDPVTVTSGQIHLTVIPVPGSARVASKKIYRLGGSSAEWRLLTILHDATTTTYIDNIRDIDLGDIMDAVEGYPYIPKTICRHNRTVILANLTDLDGTQYPCGVMVSREESYDIFDHLDFFEIEPNFGGVISWIISALDFVYVGKTNSIWKFDPNDLSLPPRCISRVYGGAGPLAVCSGENELYFLDVGKAGVVSWNGSYAEVISDSSISRGASVKNYIDNIPPAYIHLCWMHYYNQFVLIGIPQTGDTHPTLILAYYVPKRFWFVISGWNTRCAYSEKIAGVNTLHLGHATTGFVYDGFKGDTDDGADIVSILQTADDDFDDSSSRKDYGKCVLWGKKLTSTNVPLLIEPYVDTVDSGRDVIETITDLTVKRKEFGIPDLPYKGSFLGMRITATKRWSFSSLLQYARLEPPLVE